MNRRPSRTIALFAAAAFALAACGGDDDTTPAEPSNASEPGASGTAPGNGGGGAEPTVPPEYLPAIRPVEVSGEPLAPLGETAIDGDPALGLPVPVLEGEDYAGNPVRIDPASDGPTMVVFLAHWCPHCNAEIPRLVELRDEGRLPEGLDIVAVATASDPLRPNFPPGEWLDEKDWTWPVMADDIDVASKTWVALSAYGATGFPFVALVDGDGNVAARWSGESEPDEILARISEYLGL